MVGTEPRGSISVSTLEATWVGRVLRLLLDVFLLDSGTAVAHTVTAIGDRNHVRAGNPGSVCHDAEGAVEVRFRGGWGVWLVVK